MGDSPKMLGVFPTPAIFRRFRIPRRYWLSVLLCVGLFQVTWLMENIVWVAVYVVTRRERDNVSPSVENAEDSQWNMDKIQFIDLMFYVGYSVGLVPGALLVTIWSAHKLLLCSVVFSCVIHVAMINVLQHRLATVLIFQFLEGFSQGPVLPACFALFARWYPPEEMSRLVCISLSGKYLGSLVGVHLTRTLIDYIGGEMAILCCGIGGIIWSMLWTAYGFETPDRDPRITQKELSYLENSISADMKRTPTWKDIPIKSILTSLPVWTLCVVFLVYEWSHHLNFLSLSFIGAWTYHEGFWSKVPLIMLAPAVVIAGCLADWVAKRKWLSITHTRKIYVCIGLALNSTMHFAVALFVPASAITEISFMIRTCTGILGFVFAGFSTNFLDISPRYAFIVFGICQTISSASVIGFSFTFVAIMQTKLHLKFAEIVTETVRSFCYVTGTAGLICSVFAAAFLSAQRLNWDFTITEVRSSNDRRHYPEERIEENPIVVETSRF